MPSELQIASVSSVMPAGLHARDLDGCRLRPLLARVSPKLLTRWAKSLGGAATIVSSMKSVIWH
eukprot:14700412-Alexandrium_andersonii.AAC.1